MPLKYGDVVVLVKKSPDGTLSRVNAIVLASAVQPENAAQSKTALRDHRGVFAAGEYLDLAFPGEVPAGQLLKSRVLGDIFKPAFMVPAWKEGNSIGWELNEESQELRRQFDGAWAELKEQLVQALKQVVDLTAQLNQEPSPNPPAQPSAADLDAIAAEQKAAEDTSGATEN